ncbi:nuclear transport factor 2 family protein [Streptomyces sp. NPDC054919]
MSVEETNKRIVTEFLVSMSAGKIDGALALLDDQATWWISGTLEGLSGERNKAEFLDLFAGVSKATVTGTIPITPIAWTAQGERVALEARAEAKLVDGGDYNNEYHFLFIVRDGKIHTIKEYNDTDLTRATFMAG